MSQSALPTSVYITHLPISFTKHLTAIEAIPSLELKAIYSRSQSSAQDLANTVSDSVSPHSSSLTDLPARDDISAVIICLPNIAQPAISRKAWKAGKHIISEKPIAKDVSSAKSLLKDYGILPDTKPLWAVADNYRSQKALQIAAQRLNDLGGELTFFSFEMFTLVKTNNKYFNTAWRRVPEYQGGFLLDGCVHFTASLRYSLAAVNDKIASVKASTTLLQPLLLPMDTIHGVITTAGGRSGSFNVSFGSAFRSGFCLAVSTTRGEVEMNPSEVKIVTLNSKGEKIEEVIKVTKTSGVREELKAWVNGLDIGVICTEQSPGEALRDLSVLEGLLKAGETHSSEPVDA
ncbi:hypothetical protein Cpir12675_006409 [Ceratocystis pirilliformis]|uniref:Gfo/Idh/MocA-like oxidoreductase N-terminal domain-containing protein n=1 Tax=Ceratocystis pirilliformis TaxID=259994 RepID=A0ABR3YI07_9PEZI